MDWKLGESKKGNNSLKFIQKITILFIKCMGKCWKVIGLPNFSKYDQISYSLFLRGIMVGPRIFEHPDIKNEKKLKQKW